ncbi:hypothetical protein [Brevibacillus formosus]
MDNKQNSSGSLTHYFHQTAEARSSIRLVVDEENGAKEICPI